MSGDVDINGPEVTEGLVIEDIKIDRDGDCVISFRSEHGPDSICLSRYMVSWNFLRRLRSWKNCRTPVCLSCDPDTGAVSLWNPVGRSDRIGELLDSVEMIRDGYQDLFTAVVGAILTDPQRWLVNRCLRKGG